MKTDSRSRDGAAPWRQATWVVVVGGLLVRFCVGLHPYSGKGVPPMYGDYEAQRHWMELAINLPAAEWYKHGPYNNLSYWGLDYPPLSGYQSWLHGKFIEMFEPDAVALLDSNGNPSERLLALTWMLMNPALIMIDHGHFQYNSISLGFTVATVAALTRNWNVLGAICFCFSLNHKQMSLYYAPAIFAHMLGCCLQQQTWFRGLRLFATLGITVVTTFVLLWQPYMSSFEGFIGVVRRIFPTQRGLFEDYVGNFWCVSSLLLKWRRLLPPSTLMSVCTATTLLAFLPSLFMQVRRPALATLPLCLTSSAMAFFLFSYQVHEKSVLLPLLPLTMLLAARDDIGASSVMNASMISMFPLLRKDGLTAAYVALLILQYGMTLVLPWKKNRPAAAESQKWIICSTCLIQLEPWHSLLLTAAIHVLTDSISPPAKYPFLPDAVMVTWSFAHFAQLYIYSNYLHYSMYNAL